MRGACLLPRHCSELLVEHRDAGPEYQLPVRFRGPSGAKRGGHQARRHQGLMPGMTMRSSEGCFARKQEPGDLVTATLVVAELLAPEPTVKTDRGSRPARAGRRRPTSAPGDQFPPRSSRSNGLRGASAFRGHRVRLPFIYTLCPLPEFARYGPPLRRLQKTFRAARARRREALHGRSILLERPTCSRPTR